MDASHALAPAKYKEYGSAKRRSVFNDHSEVGSVSPVPWLRHLRDLHGTGFLVFLATTQHLTHGLVLALLQQVTKFIYLEYQVSGPQMQVLVGLAALPWGAKPIPALLSEAMPIAGYSKVPYMVFGGILTSVALALLDSFRGAWSVWQVCALLFVCHLGLSWVDVLSEATFAQRVREAPESGPDLLSFVMGGSNIVRLVAVAIGGALIAGGSPWSVLSFAAVPMMGVWIVSVANLNGEVPLSDGAIDEKRARLLDQPEVIGAAVIISLLSVGLLALGMSASLWSLAQACLVALAAAVLVFRFLLNPMVGKLGMYIVIVRALMVSTSGASFYFVTDDSVQYPEGPHFSKFFVATVVPGVTIASHVAGAAIYCKYMYCWTYRQLFVLANVAVAAVHLLDVVFFLRLNVPYFSDRWFVVGTHGLEAVFETWLWLPAFSMLSQLAPKGFESIAVGILSSSVALGRCISACWGGLLLHSFGVEPSGQASESSQLANLWKCSLVAHLLPILCLGLIPALIPNCKQTELPEGAAVGLSEGSWWRGDREAADKATKERAFGSA